METVTHREMRNNSGEILRKVADGETVQVTNHGRVAALIVPPGGDVVDRLVAAGEARPAVRPASTLRSIRRRTVPIRSDQLVADARGPW